MPISGGRLGDESGSGDHLSSLTGTRVTEEETRLQAEPERAAVIVSSGVWGGDKPGTAGGGEVCWTLGSTRIKGGQAGSLWRQGLGEPTPPGKNKRIMPSH